MIEFDIRTGLVLGAVLSLMISAVLASVRSTFPVQLRQPLRGWTRGTLLQAFGFIALALRGLAPDAVTVVLANAALALAWGEYLMALQRFAGREPSRPLVWALVLAVLAASAWWMEPALQAPRVAVASFAFAVLTGLCVPALLRAPQAARGPALYATMAVFAVAAVLLLVRALYYLVASPPALDPFAPSALQVAALVVGAALPVVGTIGLLLMCTDRVRAALERLARFDSLTELCNRRAIYQAANAAIAGAQRTGQPLAIAVIDVDHFKRINDKLGHAAGDRALVQLAQRLRAAARAEDQVGRVGGEEFVMVLPRCGEETARIAAERLRTSIAEQPLDLDGQQWPITVSIGVAVLRPGESNFDPVLRRADRALYAAKDAGRNRVELAAGPASGAVPQSDSSSAGPS
ncbi:MAG TPA: GGDEF domain-containing protein [Xanthomonadaceae bacterium]|nr:GGDEF domain-containing protein [Xanthomonadaceae bacterium]